MILDTDFLIHLHRAHPNAIKIASEADSLGVSIQAVMEFLQAAPDKKRQNELKGFLARQGFSVLPITATIGARALALIEEHSLGDGLRSGDALIASTALDQGQTLATGNAKHFKPIKGLSLKVFKP